LALLQEEVGAPVAAKPARGGDWSSFKQVAGTRTPLPLPPPPCVEHPLATSTATAPAPTTGDAELAALKTYRCALGLCYKYGAKWSRDHRCSPEVLQAVDPLWDSFSSSDSLVDSPPMTPPLEQVMMAISKSALSSLPTVRTVCLVGLL